MHERLKRREDDLNAVCLWKDDGVSCRPLGLCSIFTRSAERCIALQERDWAEQFCTTQMPEVAKARAVALEDATVTTATAEAAYTCSRCITHGLDSAEVTAALADLEAAEAAEERARAPVNFPKSYAFSKNGTHLYLQEELRVLQERHRCGVARHEAGERDHLGELLQHDRAGAHGRQQA